MILTITLNPSVDRTVFVDGLKAHDTNRVLRTEVDAGGKGVNLSRIAAELGAATCCTGFLGGGGGAFIKSVLLREEVRFDFVNISGETRLNVSIEDGSGEPPTTLNERGPMVQPGEWAQLLEKLETLAKQADWICMGGSIPRGLDESCYRDLANRIKAWGKPVCVDADGEPMKLALGTQPELIKPNRDEAARLLGRPIESRADALDVARSLHAQGIRYAMISLGAEGAVLACSEGAFQAVPPSIQPKSTIGSGDSLLGGFLAMQVQGAPVEEAFRWGNAAGAATALTDGASIGRLETIRELVGKVVIERA